MTYGTMIAILFLGISMVYAWVVSSNERRVTRFQKAHYITDKGRENPLDDEDFLAIFFFLVFSVGLVSGILSIILQCVSIYHENISAKEFFLTIFLVWLSIMLAILTSLFHKEKFKYEVNIFFNNPLLIKYIESTDSSFNINTMEIKSNAPVLQKISKINHKLQEWDILLNDIQLLEDEQASKKAIEQDKKKQLILKKANEKLHLLEKEIAMRLSEAKNIWNSTGHYDNSNMMKNDTSAYQRLEEYVGLNESAEEEDKGMEISKQESKEILELRQLIDEPFEMTDSFKSQNPEQWEEYQAVQQLAETTLIEILDKLDNEGRSKELDNIIRETIVTVKSARQVNDLDTM